MSFRSSSVTPVKVTPAHVLIAIAVVLIFFAPFVFKFLFPGNPLTGWNSSGMRTVWFYVASYTSLVALLFWIDNRSKKGPANQDD